MPGAFFCDTEVTPRGRVGQGGGVRGRWPMAGFRRPNGCLAPDPGWGSGFGAAGSVPRVGEDSTYVRSLQGGWRNRGIGDGLVGRNEAGVGTRWGVCGVGWVRAGNGWRGRVTLFLGYGGANRARAGETVPPGGALWDIRGTLAKQWGEHKAMAVGSDSVAGAICPQGRRFWAYLVI